MACPVCVLRSSDRLEGSGLVNSHAFPSRQLPAAIVGLRPLVLRRLQHLLVRRARRRPFKPSRRFRHAEWVYDPPGSQRYTSTPDHTIAAAWIAGLGKTGLLARPVRCVGAIAAPIQGGGSAVERRRKRHRRAIPAVPAWRFDENFIGAGPSARTKPRYRGIKARPRVTGSPAWHASILCGFAQLQKDRAVR